MGMVTPLGHSVAQTWANLLEGKSGAGPITHFDARTFPTSFACQVQGFEQAHFLADAGRYAKSGLNTRFALAAAKQALEDANLLSASGIDRTRFGCYVGSGEGSEDFNAVIGGCSAATDDGLRVDTQRFVPAALGLLDAQREEELEMHTTAGHLAEEFDLCGPNFSCLTACAASAQALGEAVELIRHGDADLMLTGGSHSMIHPFGVTGFNLLTALSTYKGDPKKASRPFDRDRDGFVLGEGSGMVVLEELDHALARKAPIYAELTGYGTTGDAYRMTDPCPDGRGAVESMRMALADAGITPADIGYINAHGTSTHANDASETNAVKGAFGEWAYRTPVSSSKSMLGHLIAAGGVVELTIAILAMRNNILPPTINYETPDPECDLDYVPNVPRGKEGIRHVLSNSFGFGGQNITLIASRYSA
jgi:3-oxoacyl-[acyl-carrier-protein] synthase II